MNTEVNKSALEKAATHPTSLCSVGNDLRIAGVSCSGMHMDHAPAGKMWRYCTAGWLLYFVISDDLNGLRFMVFSRNFP